MIKYQGLILILLMSFAQPCFSNALGEISDDLVSNLSCDNVSEKSILDSIDPQIAFSINRHIPVKNWNFSVGLYEIGACWSLSRSQRILFYLGRSDFEPTERSLKQSLNMLRKHVPQGVYNFWHVIPWTPEWFDTLVRGFSETYQNKNYVRSFKNDIQVYQNKRFHDLDNTSYLQGDRERSKAENIKTQNKLAPNTAAKMLSLIILRPARNTQHVVVVKYAITRPTGEIDYFVYDSNRPAKDIVVTYSPATQHFYAPEVVQYFNIPRPQDPVGVFLVDENDRTEILKKLKEHYTLLCQEQKSWAIN